MRKRRGMYELFSLYQFQLQLAIIMKSHIIFFSIVGISHKRSNQRHIINQNITNCAHQTTVHNTNVWNVELAIIFQVSLPVHVQNMQFTKVCYLIVVGTGFFSILILQSHARCLLGCQIDIFAQPAARRIIAHNPLVANLC